MTTGGNRPLIGVVSDRRMQGEHPFHMVGEKYLQALADGSDANPVALPSLAQGFDVLDSIDRLDGLFLTGSPSNLEPHHYLGEASEPGTWHDPERDLAALALIPAVIQAGMPLFAVCRGFQEVNVSFGGTLHQRVHEVPGYRVHKENPADPLDIQYGPSHEVEFVDGGLLHTITGQQGATVNSLHSQAVDSLGDELEVEAWAEDGLVEAFTVRDAPGFTLGVQWHPEWKVLEDPVSEAIFRAFGNACRSYRRREL
ncbi:MAG: gamma-glutamyl-gamma-aminobutyrate hydrolase family protein [Proteobacteria bacterium]|nr:gamma-glutamyl-gamma-aminobutyrate hydrolase family protein [Pseudomonadota bacterium]